MSSIATRNALMVPKILKHYNSLLLSIFFFLNIHMSHLLTIVGMCLYMLDVMHNFHGLAIRWTNWLAIGKISFSWQQKF